MSTIPFATAVDEQKKRGILIILTGPTAAGKDTVMKELLAKRQNLTRMVTTNSRPMRPGEVEGTDYYFVSRPDFEKLLSEDAFIEWVEYLGHYKGGQKKHIEAALASGKDVIWRIDVRGVKNIRPRIEEMMEDPNSPVKTAVFIFLGVKDFTIIEKRMRARGTEDEKVWNEGLNLSKWEVEQYDDCDYLVINEDDKLEDTVKAVECIIESAHRLVV